MVFVVSDVDDLLQASVMSIDIAALSDIFIRPGGATFPFTATSQNTPAETEVSSVGTVKLSSYMITSPPAATSVA